MQNNYSNEYNGYVKIFENELNKALTSINKIPEILRQSMSYAIKDGGKRIRPVLCLSVAKMLGISINLVKEFAVAVEMIHSYSLVHDDLPAMDNDDFRRGKLSTHKKFGEANGILAGDALLNFAFEYVLAKNDFSIKDYKALKLLSEYAGCSGMIAGQVLDLTNEKSNTANEEILYSIYENKTAKLIMAPILISSIIADNLYYNQLKEYAYNLGIMFQISDDILDVKGDISNIGKTPHKDELSDKLTSIKVFGLDGAIKRKEYHYEKCIESLSKISNNNFLLTLTKNMFERTK